VLHKMTSGFLARQLPGAIAGLTLIALGGCGTSSGSVVNDILDAQLQQQGVTLTGTTTRIVLVNQTQSTIEFDVLIDNVLTTITCTALDGRCTYTPETCPTTIEVVAERRLNGAGAFTGGRNYNHNPAFVFDRSKFNCSSTLVFTFTEDETTPQVL
jgi:hypothetical protein